MSKKMGFSYSSCLSKLVVGTLEQIQKIHDLPDDKFEMAEIYDILESDGTEIIS